MIGGGFSGLWAALLAKEANPGRSVVLIEGHRVGWAASGRNGGFCEASLTHGTANGRQRFPAEFGTLQRLGTENLDAIEATLDRHGIDCDFERTGAITVATQDYQVAERQAAAEADGTTFCDAEAVRAEVNSPTYLASDADGVTVRARRGVVRARRVVLATNVGATVHALPPARAKLPVDRIFGKTRVECLSPRDDAGLGLKLAMPGQTAVVFHALQPERSRWRTPSQLPRCG